MKRFYWTGGTVLSEFYLHHRESHYIDLFSENQEIHLPSINKFVGITAAKMGSKKIIYKQFLGLHTYTLFLPKRDFVDLYFIYQKKKFDLKKMIILAKTKFDWHIDPIQLGKTFMEVINLHDVPRMLISFDRNEMERFFLTMAKDLKKDILK